MSKKKTTLVARTKRKRKLKKESNTIYGNVDREKEICSITNFYRAIRSIRAVVDDPRTHAYASVQASLQMEALSKNLEENKILPLEVAEGKACVFGGHLKEYGEILPATQRVGKVWDTDTHPEIAHRIQKGAQAVHITDTQVLEELEDARLESKFVDAKMVQTLGDCQETIDATEKTLKKSRKIGVSREEIRSIEDSLESNKNSLEADVSLMSQKLSSETGDWQDIPDGEIFEASNDLWARLKTARIFDITPKTFQEFYEGADHHTTQIVAGESWRETWDANDLTLDETKIHIEKIAEAGYNLPFPEHLPFESCLFSYGEGIVITESEAWARLGASTDALFSRLRELRLISHLVCSDGKVWQFFVGKLIGRSAVTTFFRASRSGHWLRPYSLDPWIVNSVVALVNQNINLTKKNGQKLSHKLEMKRAAKTFRFKKPLPVQFYPVRLGKAAVDAAIAEATKVCKEKRSLQWKHDVRGHWRMKVQRGKLPIEDKTLNRLKKYSYEVLCHGQVTADVAEHLAKRKLDLRREGQWLAWKLIWVEDHVSPANPNLPYVPAVRLLKT